MSDERQGAAYQPQNCREAYSEPTGRGEDGPARLRLSLSVLRRLAYRVSSSHRWRPD
jgi:hypothetical protein